LVILVDFRGTFWLLALHNRQVMSSTCSCLPFSSGHWILHCLLASGYFHILDFCLWFGLALQSCQVVWSLNLPLPAFYWIFSLCFSFVFPPTLIPHENTQKKNTMLRLRRNEVKISCTLNPSTDNAAHSLSAVCLWLDFLAPCACMCLFWRVPMS
jgi:hypothetical protein